MTEPHPISYSAGEGRRVYAIGDVHGCWTLLQTLLGQIRRDNDSRAPAETFIVLLGDLVDRGTDTRSVVEHAMRYTRASPRFVVLRGNHEQLMAAALTGDARAFQGWLSVGGAETLRSWGVPARELDRAAPRRLLTAARRLIDFGVALWLERLALTFTSGDLVFVHAGVRPDVALEAQAVRDLLWIRAPFLESQEVRPYMVVHGHSISSGVPTSAPIASASTPGLT